MDPRLNVIDKRFEKVKRIIAVSGGKGGIGKSLTASVLALILAEQGFQVGLLDLDFCGPSGHVILGIQDVFPVEEKGLVPPVINGISFMSIIYFTGANPAPLRGSEVSNAIIELLAITQWHELDFLIIDMPPGIGDPAMDTIRLIKRVEFLVVTTRSLVALSVMKKELQVLQELGKPVLGVLENMKTSENSAVRDEATMMGASFLGSVDFDLDLENALGDMNKLKRTSFAGQLKEIMARTKLF
ncbi:MAG: antiporter inner membrane protein [Pelotomaculum sp. PtaB.Bin104]|nr:MAG: antiporter inner membrane protein [Pelotomaculum sp. PtaB.Bin104]